MEPTEATTYLQLSRQNLASSYEGLNRLYQRNPELYERLFPKFLELANKQLHYEDAIRQEQTGNFGLVWLPVIAVAGAVAIAGGSGFWWLSQHEDTSKYKTYLECVNSMSDEFEMQGMTAHEASREAAKICKQPWGDENFIEKIANGIGGIFGLDFKGLSALLLVGGLGYFAWKVIR